MPHDKLNSLKRSHPGPSAGPRSRRVPPVLFPLGLLIAFLAIFGLLFGDRLLPAQSVRVAPVIALRTSDGGTATSPPITSNPVTGRQSLLFQASGWVEPDPYIISVPTLVKGVVKDVFVLEGQSVKKDELLATLIDDDAKLDVEEAERKIRTLDATQVAHCAELPVLNSEMHAIQKRIDKEKALLAELADAANRYNSVPKGSVPELEVRKAQLQVKRQQAAVDAAAAELPGILSRINKVDLERLTVDARIKEAQTELNRKKLALERTRITAPIDGIVLRLHASPGKKRMLDSDDPTSALIVELYDPNKLQARIDVPLTEAAALRVGQPVRISTDLLPDVKFDAEVTRIVGEADLQRNTLQAKVKIRNPDARLRPEMLVRAEFYPAPASSSPDPNSTNPGSTASATRLSIYAPVPALIDRTSTTARAWIADQNRARLRDLKIGSEERDGHLLIHDGLLPGDKVILPPFDKLEPNKRIKVSN